MSRLSDHFHGGKGTSQWSSGAAIHALALTLLRHGNNTRALRRGKHAHPFFLTVPRDLVAHITRPPHTHAYSDLERITMVYALMRWVHGARRHTLSHTLRPRRLTVCALVCSRAVRARVLWCTA